MKMFELLPRPLGSIFRKLTHLTCNSPYQLRLAKRPSAGGYDIPPHLYKCGGSAQGGQAQGATYIRWVSGGDKAPRNPYFSAISRGLSPKIRFQPNGFQGPRSYLCRHRVQFRRADILSHICTGGARACTNFFGKLCAMFYSAPAGKRSPLGTSPGNRRRDLCDSANWITDWIPSNFFGAAPTANLSMVLSPARNRR